MSKKLISGCMITKNADEYLDVALRNMIDYVDEIIVVDDNSTDDTHEIVKSHPNTKLITGTYNRNKVQQRNEYIRRAKGEWIFCPDDDEIFYKKDLEWLRTFAENPGNNLWVKIRHMNFWKDYRHVVRGYIWDQIHQRFFKNLPGIGYHDTHTTVSVKPGQLLSKYTDANGFTHPKTIAVPHYGWTKSAIHIRDKVEYYMQRDNPQCVDEYTTKVFADLHPYFSERYDIPRFGRGGLYCAGCNTKKHDWVLPFNGPHPKIMQTHPAYERLFVYPAGMNTYMENHWQYHNHLDHERHQNRIKFTGQFCRGKTLDVGCANGFSTQLMAEHNLGAVFHGAEATDWGYSQACMTYPGLEFTKAYGENLPFADDEFDTVLMSEIIEHVYDPRLLVDEGWRVAKRQIIVTTPTQNHPDPDHKRFFSIADMREFLQKYTNDISFFGLTKNGAVAKHVDDIYFQIAVVRKA